MSPLLIINPAARLLALNPQLATQIHERLRADGMNCDVAQTTRHGEAAEMARAAAEAGCPQVIVAAGDGTIGEAVNGLAGTQTVLGIIPLGTGNILGESFGLAPGDVEAACRVIGAGQARAFDVGCLNGRHFVGMAGVGLDAWVATHAEGQGGKSRLGRYAFVAEFLRAVGEVEPWEFEARVDGQRVAGTMWGLFISNSADWTWRVRLTPEARPDDGRLHFVFLRECSRPALLWTATSLFALAKDAHSLGAMEVIPGMRLTLHTEPEAPWEADGEVGGSTPVECELKPGALRVLAPGPSEAWKAAPG